MSVWRRVLWTGADLEPGPGPPLWSDALCSLWMCTGRCHYWCFNTLLYNEHLEIFSKIIFHLTQHAISPLIYQHFWSKRVIFCTECLVKNFMSDSNVNVTLMFKLINTFLSHVWSQKCLCWILGMKKMNVLCISTSIIDQKVSAWVEGSSMIILRM